MSGPLGRPARTVPPLRKPVPRTRMNRRHLNSVRWRHLDDEEKAWLFDMYLDMLLNARMTHKEAWLQFRFIGQKFHRNWLFRNVRWRLPQWARRAVDEARRQRKREDTLPRLAPHSYLPQRELDARAEKKSAGRHATVDRRNAGTTQG